MTYLKLWQYVRNLLDSLLSFFSCFENPVENGFVKMLPPQNTIITKLNQLNSDKDILVNLQNAANDWGDSMMVYDMYINNKIPKLTASLYFEWKIFSHYAKGLKRNKITALLEKLNGYSDEFYHFITPLFLIYLLSRRMAQFFSLVQDKKTKSITRAPKKLCLLNTDMYFSFFLLEDKEIPALRDDYKGIEKLAEHIILRIADYPPQEKLDAAETQKLLFALTNDINNLFQSTILHCIDKFLECMNSYNFSGAF